MTENLQANAANRMFAQFAQSGARRAATKANRRQRPKGGNCVRCRRYMSIFGAELRKLLGSRRVVLTIAAVVIINIALLIIPEYSGRMPAAYNAVWTQLDKLPAGERAEFVKSRILDRDDPDYFSGTAEFSDNFFFEQNLLRDILAEIEQADNYPAYLKSIDDTAENMKAMSFFSNKNSFIYRNIIKTQKDFSALSTDNVTPDKSRGVLMAVRFGASDILMILLVLAFTVKLVTSERELGYFPLIRTSVNGRGRLSAAKLAALTVSACAAAVVLYGSGIAAGAAVYGLGDLQRGVQSVYGFFSCERPISVGTFLLLFILTKLLLCVSFSAVVYLFSALPVGGMAGYVLALAFVAVETALYYTIPATSVRSPLRQINLVAAADSANLIGKYLNINFFGTPLNGDIAALSALLILAAACSAAGIFMLSCKLFERKRSVRKGLIRGANTSLALHELYKCFVGGKAVLMLLAAAAAAVVLQKPVKPYYNSISDYIYNSYVSRLQGEYTAEKTEYIQSELEAVLMDFSEQGMIKREALENLLRHAEYLSENGGFFVNDTGYKMLTGEASVRVYDRLAAAVKTLVLIFIAAYSYSAEHRSGAIMLLRSTRNGKAPTFFRKMLAAVLCSFLILAIFDGSRIFSVLKTWGTALFTAPANSMEHLSSVSMSILSYVVLTEILRFIGMLIVSAGVFFISQRVKNYSGSVIMSAAFFAVPLVLSAIGFEFLDYFLTDPFLIGNVIR